MTIREYEKALAELRAAVNSLSEENTLLRDFAYNIDPNSRIIHAHMFNQNSLSQSHSKPRPLSARQSVHGRSGSHSRQRGGNRFSRRASLE